MVGETDATCFEAKTMYCLCAYVRCRLSTRLSGRIGIFTSVQLRASRQIAGSMNTRIFFLLLVWKEGLLTRKLLSSNRYVIKGSWFDRREGGVCVSVGGGK